MSDLRPKQMAAPPPPAEASPSSPGLANGGSSGPASAKRLLDRAVSAAGARLGRHATLGDGLPKVRRRADDLRREHQTLVRHRTDHLVDVRQPLVLVSQIQRSGGTLMSQLLDGHPEIHAHPQELRTGFPKKYDWPPLPLEAGPDEWFRVLWEKPTARGFEEGYSKVVDLKTRESGEETFPFVFPPLVQKAIFDFCVAHWSPASARDVFDCYMTSYFNAWLDNHNLYGPPKKWVSAFAARLNANARSVQAFFDTYPDGRLVSIVRDPRSWYLSARRYLEVNPSPGRTRDYGDIETAVRLWSESTEAMLAARETYGERFYLLTFEGLLADTESAMRGLAEYLGIEWRPSLVEPSFNGLPIKADSSFQVKGHGVNREPLQRFRELLTPEEIAFVDERATPLYERAAELSAR
jgi:hypothetical protein